jgi:diacylglycerol kinase family enzyme
MTRWAILCNQSAGSYNPRRLEQVQQALRANRVESRVIPTAYRGHATDLCRAISDVDTVAVYGGDGTLNEAANGLLGRGIALAFLPGGTANVMAYELGLPQDPVRAARLLTKGDSRIVYPGIIDGRVFLLMAGIGFDGMAVHKVSPRIKSNVGKLAYVYAGLQAFVNPQPALQVINGSIPVPGGHWVVVSRARYYGGPYVIDRDGGLAKPELSLIVVPQRGLLPFLVGTLGLRLRKPRGGAMVQHGREFRIHAESPVFVQLDGEAFSSGQDFAVGISAQPLLMRYPARVKS